MSTDRLQAQEIENLTSQIESDDDRAWFISYINDPSMNATEAARKLGTQGDAARKRGYRLKQKYQHLIDRYIALRREFATLKEGLDPTMVLRELSRIAYVNPGKWFRFDEQGRLTLDEKDIPYSDWAAIDNIEVNREERGEGENKVVKQTIKIKMGGKQNALVNLGRHLQLFPQAMAQPPEETRRQDEINENDIIDQIFDTFEPPADEV